MGKIIEAGRDHSALRNPPRRAFLNTYILYSFGVEITVFSTAVYLKFSHFCTVDLESVE